MPDNKNQHFVPQCYLRNFSEHSSKRSVGVFRIETRSGIGGASIRGQCSRPYFYGAEGVFERGFLELEGRYAATARLIEGYTELTAQQDAFLRAFVMIQLFRTPFQIERIRTRQEEVTTAIYGAHHPERPELLDPVHMAVAMGVESLHLMRHTRRAILVAPRDRSFFSSDNPVSFINKYHIQRRRDRNFGYGNAGGIFILPISPAFCVLYYDQHAYSVPRTNPSSYIELRSDDVDRINAGTLIFATKNLYGPSFDSQYIISLIEEYGHLRAEFESNTQTLRRVAGEQGAWEAVDGNPRSGESIIVGSYLYPAFGPNFRFLRHRTGFQAYETNTLAGAFSTREVFEYIHAQRDARNRRARAAP